MSSTTEETPPAQASTSASADGLKSSKPKKILGIFSLILLLGVGYGVWHWFSYGRFHEETDDAYLQADLITLLARDTGYIFEILVAPNATVAKDQVIARIDPEDYKLALEKAKNDLASAQSALVQLDAQIGAGQAAIQQAQAALSAAEATSDGAQKAYQRVRSLRDSSVGNQASLDAAEATAKSAAANVASAEAALAQAQAALAVLKAQKDSAELTVAAAEISVKVAKRDLDFTELRAPFAGVLTERQIEVGSFVTAGSRIGTLVPTDDIYVEANFKETQIADIREGAEVTLQVDAWAKEDLHGKVVSLTAGTGQVFSLLPSSNATGNFTKVVQRVPVRIEIDPDDRARLPLRPGMSVVVEVDTRTGEKAPQVARVGD
nr:HlyD family secretion protein [uncultured Celeribacter sp.]